MKRTGRKKEWSIALFCAGLIFLFPPILSIYNSPDVVFGLPVAYVVLYGFWGFLIVAMAYGAKRKTRIDAHVDHSIPMKNRQSDN